MWQDRGRKLKPDSILCCCPCVPQSPLLDYLYFQHKHRGHDAAVQDKLCFPIHVPNPLKYWISESAGGQYLPRKIHCS